MSVDYNDMSSSDQARGFKARRGSAEGLQSSPDWPKYAVCIAAAASLVTVLSIFQFIGFQALPPQAGALIVAVAVVGIMGICAGLFSYIAIRAVDFLAGHDLLRVLTGTEPISIRWLFLPALGLIVGGGVALCTGLAVALLLPL